MERPHTHLAHNEIGLLMICIVPSSFTSTSTSPAALPFGVPPMATAPFVGVGHLSPCIAPTHALNSKRPIDFAGSIGFQILMRFL